MNFEDILETFCEEIGLTDEEARKELGHTSAEFKSALRILRLNNITGKATSSGITLTFKGEKYKLPNDFTKSDLPSEMNKESKDAFYIAFRNKKYCGVGSGEGRVPGAAETGYHGADRDKDEYYHQGHIESPSLKKFTYKY